MSLNDLPTGQRVKWDEHGEKYDTDSYTSHRKRTQRCVQGAKLIRGGEKKRGKVEKGEGSKEGQRGEDWLERSGWTW